MQPAWLSVSRSLQHLLRREWPDIRRHGVIFFLAPSIRIVKMPRLACLPRNGNGRLRCIHGQVTVCKQAILCVIHRHDAGQILSSQTASMMKSTDNQAKKKQKEKLVCEAWHRSLHSHSARHQKTNWSLSLTVGRSDSHHCLPIPCEITFH